MIAFILRALLHGVVPRLHRWTTTDTRHTCARCRASRWRHNYE